MEERPINYMTYESTLDNPVAANDSIERFKKYLYGGMGFLLDESETNDFKEKVLLVDFNQHMFSVINKDSRDHIRRIPTDIVGYKIESAYFEYRKEIKKILLVESEKKWKEKREAKLKAKELKLEKELAWKKELEERSSEE